MSDPWLGVYRGEPSASHLAICGVWRPAPSGMQGHTLVVIFTSTTAPERQELSMVLVNVRWVIASFMLDPGCTCVQVVARAPACIGLHVVVRHLSPLLLDSSSDTTEPGQCAVY